MVVYNSCELENLPCMLPLAEMVKFSTYTNKPVIDDAMTVQEMQAVELLIRNEPANNTLREEHPMVSEVLPLRRSFDSSLMRDIEHYETENPHTEEPQEPLLPQTITMDRYTNFGEGSDFDYHRLYTALSYSAMRQRSASLIAQNQHHIEINQQAHLKALAQIDQSYHQQSERKRTRVDDLNKIRKKRQQDFAPVNIYLERRFEEGVSSIIDVGIERALNQN